MLHTLCNLTICIFILQQVELTSQYFPRFAEKNEKVVKYQVGATAKLHCYVERISSSTVTWIRQSDLEILSAGVMRVTGDSRIQINKQRPNDFCLEISGVKMSDAGLYECQINMIPLKSLIVNLVVDDTPLKPTSSTSNNLANIQEQDPVSGSSTEILGSPDIYISPGTLVNLTCVITSSVAPGRVFWYHEGKVISYYSAREGVSLHIDSKNLTQTVASLLMKRGWKSDEGTYTCRPEKPFLKSATARLFFIDGTRSQARKTNGSNERSLLYILYILLVINLLTYPTFTP